MNVAESARRSEAKASPMSKAAIARYYSSSYDPLMISRVMEKSVNEDRHKKGPVPVRVHALYRSDKIALDITCRSGQFCLLSQDRNASTTGSSMA